MADVDPARELAEWLDERTAAGAFSGVALVRRDGETRFAYAGGLAHRGHGVPIRSDTRFGIASITKLVTATTVLRLVERGQVRLDQPVIELLPDAWRPMALTPAHTLHHLLSHTSGLANYFDDVEPGWASFTSSWDRIPMYRIRHPLDMFPLFAGRPAVRPPGERYEYCDTNFLLAGLVVEAVTGRPFNDVAIDEVLLPAGMVDSGFEPLDADPPRLATGYMGDGPPEHRPSNIYSVTVMGMPDGGMLASAPDLARLIDELLAGNLVSGPLLAAMTTPHAPPNGEVEQYGYGLTLWVANGEVIVLGHGGSDPGVGTLVSHYRRDRTTVVVLCNQDRGAWPATRQIAATFGLSDPRS